MFDASGGNVSAAESASARWELMKRSLEVAGANPIRWLFGVGLENFHIVSIKELVGHNSYLQVFNEIGLPAMIFYVLFLVSVIRITARIAKRYRRARGYRAGVADGGCHPDLARRVRRGELLRLGGVPLVPLLSGRFRRVSPAAPGAQPSGCPPPRKRSRPVCGIYGAFSTDGQRPIQADLLDRMAHVLAHRGPDGAGRHLAGPFGMGMRRLSIIDLAGGDQPIANEDGTVWVVFNGEIYNYRELTADLIARGHRFATSSDTEVLVHLYEEYGERCVEPLRGMFAFAIWDQPRRALLLARDRLGIKPLYYAATPDGFLFGSELKALVQSPWLSPRLDRRGLAAYLEYGYVPDPLSILDGVVKGPARAHPHRSFRAPGCASAVLAGDHLTSEPAAAPGSETQAAEDLWRKLEEAVRFHMVSDVPVGAFLSGGVDSSAVVSIMARISGRPIKTFSVGFLERPLQRAAARAAGRRGLRHRAPRAPRRAQRPEGPRGAAGELRRAVRRLFGHSDLPGLATGEAACEGRALRRRRGRAVRRVRSLRRRSSTPPRSACSATLASAPPCGRSARSCRLVVARTRSTTCRCRDCSGTSTRSLSSRGRHCAR